MKTELEAIKPIVRQDHDDEEWEHFENLSKKLNKYFKVDWVANGVRKKLTYSMRFFHNLEFVDKAHPKGINTIICVSTIGVLEEESHPLDSQTRRERRKRELPDIETLQFRLQNSEGVSLIADLSSAFTKSSRKHEEAFMKLLEDVQFRFNIFKYDSLNEILERLRSSKTIDDRNLERQKEIMEIISEYEPKSKLKTFFKSIINIYKKLTT